MHANYQFDPNFQIFLNFNGGDRTWNNLMLFACLSTANTSRHEVSYRYWVNEATDLGYEVLFVADKPNPVHNIKILLPNKELYKYARQGVSFGDIDRGVKRITSAEYFIRNTTAGWLWIASDDVYIKNDRIPKMIKDLNTKYNTENENIVLGDCVECNEYRAFLQGGIGYILSRAAARKFIEYGPTWMKLINWCDDRDFNHFLNYIGLPRSKSAMPWGIGHVFVQKSYENFPNVSDCNPNYYQGGCGRGLYNVADLVGVHYSQDSVSEQYANRVFEWGDKNQDLYWYPDGKANPYLCRLKK